MAKTYGATISVNGGPEVPLDLAMAAVKAIKRRKSGGGDQVAEATRDIEEITGTNESNDEKLVSAVGARLRSLVERIERIEGDRRELAGDVKDLYQEVKSAGFDVKVVRQLIKLRKQVPAEAEEQEILLDVYRRAIGM